MTAGHSTTVAAGIVIYRPDPDLLEALVCTLSGQVDRIFLYRNSPLDADRLEGAHARGLIDLGTERNLGVGVAHNEIMKAALARGIEHVLLLDQDSTPLPNLAEQLLVRMKALIHAGLRPAVVGPRPIGADGTPYKVPRPLHPAEAAPQGTSTPVEFLISSGSLIDCGAFTRIGAFRDDFFIDAIDIEWCLRARSQGFTCWMATDVPMGHRLGAGIVRLPLVGLHLVRQPPARAYTFVRNQLVMFRLGHVSLRWKARAAAHLAAYTLGQIINAPHRRPAVRALARGWWDGLRGRLGPP